jgi:hypothetical protein
LKGKGRRFEFDFKTKCFLPAIFHVYSAATFASGFLQIATFGGARFAAHG